MIRAQKARKHRRQLQRHEAERDRVPPHQDHLLELQEPVLAARQDRARVASVAHCRFHERAEVSTTVELILNAETPVEAESLTPLRVDLAFEVEGALLVSDVAGSHEKSESRPEKEVVDCEERAVIEEDARPANEGCDDADAGRESRNDEFRSIPNAHDVRAVPNIEPSEETENESND